jgi:hypothetical protein
MPNWEYKTQVGPLIDDITLAGLGAHGGELVTVLPPKLATIPIGVPGPVPNVFPEVPRPNGPFPVAYADNSHTYIFKKPT